MANGTYKKGVKKREIIIDAAESLCYEKGCDSVSIADICKRADIAPGNLTYYFKKKKDILQEVFARMLDKCELETHNALPPDASQLDYVCLGTKLFMSMICLDKNNGRILIDIYENQDSRSLVTFFVEVYYNNFPLPQGDHLITDKQRHYLIAVDSHGKLGILRDLLQRTNYEPSIEEIQEMAEAVFLLTCCLCGISEKNACDSIEYTNHILAEYDYTKLIAREQRIQ